MAELQVEQVAEHLANIARLREQTGGRITSEMDLIKAYRDDALEQQKRQLEQARRSDPNAILVDPSNVLNYLGSKAKPSPIGFQILRQMATKVKPVAAIIQTRMNEISKFSRRPYHATDTGFKIALKDRKRKPTMAEEKQAFNLEEAFLNTGIAVNVRRRDNFDTFLRKIVRDSLTLDAVTFENVTDRLGRRVVEWWAVDAATIEPVVDNKYNAGEGHWQFPVYEPQTSVGRAHPTEIEYVQRYQGEIIAEFPTGSLVYGIRNPRTDIEFALYGLSELELLIETVTSHLNAEKYNASYFTHSNLPQGILSAVGKYDPDQLAEFRREWQATVSGVVGKHKVPFFAASEGAGIAFTPFKQNNKEMEFSSWLEYLTTITCAIYGTDPSEIGFRGFSSGGGNSKVESDAQKSKMDNAKDKGFKPLMTFLAELFNRYILPYVAPDFEFQWVGLDPDDEEAKINLAKLRLEAGITVPAIEQKAMDITLEGVVPEGEDITWIYKPVNTVAAQYVTGAQQAQMQADQGAQQHQQTLEQQAQQHGQAKEMEQMKHGHVKELAQFQHGQKLEQAIVGGHVQGANAKAADDRKGELAQVQHGHKLEQQAQVHEQAKAEAEYTGDIDEKGAQAQHGRDMETLAAQHAQAMEQGDVEREHDGHQRDKDREVKAEADKAKAKTKPKGRKLTKSITIEILE